MSELRKVTETRTRLLRAGVASARDSAADAVKAVREIIEDGQPVNGLASGLRNSLKLLTDAETALANIEGEHFREARPGALDGDSGAEGDE